MKSVIVVRYFWIIFAEKHVNSIELILSEEKYSIQYIYDGFKVYNNGT